MLTTTQSRESRPIFNPDKATGGLFNLKGGLNAKKGVVTAELRDIALRHRRAGRKTLLRLRVVHQIFFEFAHA